MRILALLVAGWSGPAAAQEVTFTGQGDVNLDPRLRHTIQSGDYVLITRDTLIAAGDTVPRTALVLDATVYLEGTVAGDLVGVDAGLFVRPTARIHGDIVNLAGGLYRSELATITGDTVNAPLAPYAVVRENGGLRIEGRNDAPAFELDGLMGFAPPTYDRVNALGLDWSGGLRLPAVGRFEPRVNGRLGYRSGRGALDGTLELEARRGRMRAAVGVDQRPVTNEEWIRGDLRNSLSFLINGNDARDYYQAERAYAELAREFGREGRGFTVFLRGQAEHDESLGAGDPWVLFDDSPRPNPPIDDGTIASLILGAEGDWIGRSSAAEAGVDLEFAAEVPGADFSFARYLLWGEWAMDALSNHLLEIELRLQGPLPGSGSLPRQRWTFVGGSSTLNTFELAQFRGDRLVYAETEYVIPLPQRFSLPVVGAPELRLIHVVGMAWTDGTERDLAQNIGVRLQFFSPYIRLMTNPEDPLDDFDLDFGLAWPFDDDWPWRGPR